MKMIASVLLALAFTGPDSGGATGLDSDPSTLRGVEPVETALRAVLDDLPETTRSAISVWASSFTEESVEGEKRAFSLEATSALARSLSLPLSNVVSACLADPGASLLSAAVRNASRDAAEVTVSVTERAVLGAGLRIFRVRLTALDGEWFVTEFAHGARVSLECP